MIKHGYHCSTIGYHCSTMRYFPDKKQMNIYWFKRFVTKESQWYQSYTFDLWGHLSGSRINAVNCGSVVCAYKEHLAKFLNKSPCQLQMEVVLNFFVGYYDSDFLGRWVFTWYLHFRVISLCRRIASLEFEFSASFPLLSESSRRHLGVTNTISYHSKSARGSIRSNRPNNINQVSRRSDSHHETVTRQTSPPPWASCEGYVSVWSCYQKQFILFLFPRKCQTHLILGQ